MPRSDQGIICEWMESKPQKGPFDFRPWASVSPRGWWEATGRRGAFLPSRQPNTWEPRTLRLNALRKVESRLSNKQKDTYDFELAAAPDRTEYLWHASAEQKIKALAAVLRPLVEKEE